MFAYIALTLVLLVLAYWEAVSRDRVAAPITLAALALIAFVGLRFETGADWLEYETLLYMTAPLFSNLPMYFNPNLVVEPGFVFLLSAINTFGLPFQALLFTSAALSISVLAVFLRRYSDYPTLVLLWYCGFALLLGQMAAIRQVIAYAFLMLAFMAYDRGRTLASAVWAAVAVLMHVFAIVLLPIIFLRLRPPGTRIVLVACGVGLVTTFVGISIFALLVAPISLVLGGIVETKLEIYSGFAAFRISPFALALILWHATVLVLINRSGSGLRDHAIVRCAIYAAIWSLVAHTFLATLPAIWNRVMLLSMPLELLALLYCYAGVLRQPLWRGATLAGVWAVSAASIGYGLWQDNALPYIPYRSVPQVWLTGDPGDGRLRYMVEQDRLNRRAEEQRQP